jgi:hypothetical protein
MAQHTQGPARDDDKFSLSPRASLYVTFLECGYVSDDAHALADYAVAHPHKLLEDCKPSVAREWKAALARCSSQVEQP